MKALYKIWRKSVEWLLRSRVHKILSAKICNFANNARILRESKILLFVAHQHVIRKPCIKYEGNRPSGYWDLACTRFLERKYLISRIIREFCANRNFCLRCTSTRYMKALYKIWRISAERLLRSRMHKILSAKIRNFANNSRILRESNILFFVAHQHVIRKPCTKYEGNRSSGYWDLACTRFLSGKIRNFANNSRILRESKI